MVLEKMSPKATYNVPILEHIDISAPEYTRPTEKSLSTTLEGVEDRRKVAVKVNIPRYGYTRGEHWAVQSGRYQKEIKYTESFDLL